MSKNRNYDMTAAEFQAYQKQKKQPQGRKAGNGDKAKADMEMVLKLFGIGYDKEVVFHQVRKWRFDFTIPALKVAIEYEGVICDKSRHLTIGGFMEDCLKYREAVKQGWRLLRYTAKDYQNLAADVQQITGLTIPEKIDCKTLKSK